MEGRRIWSFFVVVAFCALVTCQGKLTIKLLYIAFMYELLRKISKKYSLLIPLERLRKKTIPPYLFQ